MDEPLEVGTGEEVHILLGNPSSHCYLGCYSW